MQLHQQSPRPTPRFFEAPCFSQRKKTPNRQPPKAPVKSCPPVSRIFSSSHNDSTGVRFVSFLAESQGESTNSTSVSTPHYDPTSRQPYFEQCFNVVAKVGEGSFGEVFKVKFKEDGRLYAIKRSRQRFRGDNDRWRKLHEVERHQGLSPHPNCIRFYRAWEERLHLYIMTELCQMSLAEYADLHGKLPEKRVWNVLLDLTQGLKHLHDNRLCHLDVKPANIFVSQDGYTCKLGDFGLTVSIDSGFHEASEGDSRYIPKELLSGQFSTAADIFSLGISLLELACDLELPSEGEGWHRLREGQLPLPFIKDLSPTLVQLLTSMMDPSPSNRPGADTILTHPSLRRMALIRPFIRTSHATGTMLRYGCGHVYRWVLTLFSVLLVLLRISPWGDAHSSPSVLAPPQSDKVPLSPDRSGVGGASIMDTTNNCLSDSDEELEMLSRSFINQSSSSGVVNSSPFTTAYTRPVYAGSPVPLDFNEHHLTRLSPPIRTSSPNVLGERSRRRPVRNINIGPRNLMEMFNESASN